MSSPNGTKVLPAIERDRKVTGLHLRHFRTKSVWYLSYRRDGAQRRPRLGDARVVSRQEARQRALEMLAAVARGEDPKRARRASARPTVAELAARYERDYLPRKKLRSQDEDRALWRLHLLPRFGTAYVDELTPADVVAMQNQMWATPYRANAAVKLLHKAYVLANQWGWCTGNPAKVERFREHKRRRVPTPDEVGRILTALERAEPEFAGLVRLLMLTGCRLREVMHARREWVTEAGLCLPDSKAGERIVPLSRAAREVIDALPVMLGNPYLIQGRRESQPMQSPKSAWKRVLDEAGVRDLRLHDLRRLYASTGLTAGLSLEAIGQLLGHRDPKTTRGYAYLQTAAAQEAAEAVAAALTPKP